MDLVLISGHTSGLGHELMQIYLERGATVIGMARRSLPSTHPRLSQFPIDFTRETPWEDRLRSSLPRQDFARVILINSAGTIQPTAPFGQMSGEQIQKALQLNLTAPLRLMNLVVALYPQSPLQIVNISSGAAKKPYRGWSAYCSSKAGLALASAVLAQEMEGQGRNVKVLSYSPGPIDTPMQQELRKKSPQDFPDVGRFIELHENGRLRSAREAALDLSQKLESPDLPAFAELALS